MTAALLSVDLGAVYAIVGTGVVIFGLLLGLRRIEQVESFLPSDAERGGAISPPRCPSEGRGRRVA